MVWSQKQLSLTTQTMNKAEYARAKYLKSGKQKQKQRKHNYMNALKVNPVKQNYLQLYKPI